MNWACSEFLNMLQEVKQVAIKKEPVIVEPHTLHLISACFDFAVGMVRVIEMAVKITNGIIVPDNNEVLISRLMQVRLPKNSLTWTTSKKYRWIARGAFNHRKNIQPDPRS